MHYCIKYSLIEFGTLSLQPKGFSSSFPVLREFGCVCFRSSGTFSRLVRISTIRILTLDPKPLNPRVFHRAGPEEQAIVHTPKTPVVAINGPMLGSYGSAYHSVQ